MRLHASGHDSRMGRGALAIAAFVAAVGFAAPATASEPANVPWETFLPAMPSDNAVQPHGVPYCRKATIRCIDTEVRRLYEAIRAVLMEWGERLKAEATEKFPEGVTAFREGMAVHGRFGKPCPRCGHPVQRIRYADRECNYCAVCQVGGRLLADRALSRLLREDWPKALEDLEELKDTRRRPM